MYGTLIASQLPAMHDYAHATRVYWESSRHQQNARDIMAAGWESARHFGIGTRWILRATVALELLELGPGNETLLTNVGGNVLDTTNSPLLATGAVGATTGLLELGIGLGVAYGLNKFRPAVNILKERYLAKPEATKDEIKLPEKEELDWKQRILRRSKTALSRWGKFYGVAALSGAAGATIYEDSKGERTTRENMKTAAVAAGMLAVGQATLAGALVGVAATAEALGVEDGVEKFADLVSSPITPAVIFGGIAGWHHFKTRREFNKKVKSGEIVLNPHPRNVTPAAV